MKPPGRHRQRRAQAKPQAVPLEACGMRAWRGPLSWESQVKSGETTHKIQDTHVDYFWIGSVHWIIFGSVYFRISSLVGSRIRSDHRIGSPDRITGSDHWIGSLERITGSDHWIGSLDRITGSDHGYGSPDQITGSDHRIGSPDRITESDH
jgi:hypothetical protein